MRDKKLGTNRVLWQTLTKRSLNYALPMLVVFTTTSHEAQFLKPLSKFHSQFPSQEIVLLHPVPVK